MALSDRQRHDAYEALTEAFADNTDLVIEMLRPDHDQLATKSDLERFATKDDLQQFATKDDMELLEVRLVAEVDRRVHEAFAAQTRTLMIGLVMAFMLTAITNVLTVTLG